MGEGEYSTGQNGGRSHIITSNCEIWDSRRESFIVTTLGLWLLNCGKVEDNPGMETLFRH